MIRCVVNFFVFFQASSFCFRFLLTVNKYHLCFDLWNNLPFLRRISHGRGYQPGTLLQTFLETR